MRLRLWNIIQTYELIPKKGPDVSTRDKLVRAAGRLFARHGFDAVSVRDIARAARVNLGAVTYHFGGKEALFEEVVARKIDVLRKKAELVYESKLRPDEKLRKMLETFAFSVLYEDPGLKVFFAEMLMGGDRLPKAAVEAVEWRNRIFSEVVREGIDQGLFRECDVECAAWSFFGMLSAYILYQPLMGKAGRCGPYPKAYVKRVVDSATDVFMGGIRKDRRASRAVI